MGQDGCDIRRIQKVLGHVRLDTTTIYITVAKERTNFASPLDRLSDSEHSPGNQSAAKPKISSPPRLADSVGTIRLHCRIDPSDDRKIQRSCKRHQFTIEIKARGRREYLIGSQAQQTRPGFVQIDLPPIEQWQEAMSRLPSAVVKRMEEPEFYQTLQQSISTRLIRETAAANTAPATPVPG